MVIDPSCPSLRPPARTWWQGRCTDSRDSAAAGHFFLGGRNLAQGLGIVVMSVRMTSTCMFFQSEIFRRGQRHTRSGDTLDGGVVGQVGEQNGTVDGSGAAKV